MKAHLVNVISPGNTIAATKTVPNMKTSIPTRNTIPRPAPPSSRALSVLAIATTLFVAVLAPLPAGAATIFWGPATTISADSDVITSGTALYAYTGGSAKTVNGVAFTAGSGFATWGSVSFTSGFTGVSATAFWLAASPFQDLSPAYTNVLRGAAYGGTAAGTVTLNGLTPGHDYSVQIWVSDPRSAGSGRTETINGSAVTLDYNSSDIAGGVGQYVVGYFTASSTSQAFTMTPSASGSVQLNAISVRDAGLPQRIWLGSTGTSWGTNGNWSPATVPFPGDAITFNALSTANLGTMLDLNYTVGTLTLSNAPSAVTIGSDGNTLTINGGINLLGAGQSLTINDAVVLGAFQTWTNNGTLNVNADVSGSAALTLAGNGVVTFSQPATYLYKTTINGGTLKLSGSGSLTSSTITVAGGATFDISAISYSLSGVTLNNSSAGAVLNGTSDCSSGTLSMTYDGVNPAFIQTNGTMTLSGGTVIDVNNPGAVLATGNHTIIAVATAGNIGQVTGSLPGVNLTGNGAVGAVSLATNGSGGLDLVVGAADVWTGASDSSWANAGNWSGGVTPDIGTNVVFNNLSTANLSTVLNQDFVLAGVSILNPAGPVAIGGANNLGISASGINMQSASHNLTITAPVQVLADQQWNVTNNRTLNINGGVSGASGVIIVGAGTVNLNSAATYAGNTTVSSNSTLKMTTANVLPNGLGTGDFYVNGLLDLNGFSEAIGGLNGSGIVDNTSGSAVTLTIGANGGNCTNNGIIKNTGGALQLQVAGGNVQLLSTNTYRGGTIFNGGNLWFPNSSVLGTGPVTFNPGSGAFTYGVTFTNALTLNGAYLHLGGGGYPNLVNQTWSGPVTVVNGFSMSGDNQGCTLTLSGPMNIGTGGISVTNFGNNGPQMGFAISTTGDLLSGPISGSGGITYYLIGGNSRLTVQGANTYSGGTIVNGDPSSPGGKLSVGGSTNAFSTGPVTLNANAIIEAAPGSATITNALTLNGGTLQSEPQYNNYNQLFWTGPITVTADSSFVQSATGALNNNQSSGVNVSGSLNIINSTLTCSCPVACYGGNTISGSISGTGTILQNGNNVLAISGSNTFSGTFRSVLGTLNVQNAYALQNATLDMNASDVGAVSFNNLNHVIGALTGSRNLGMGSGTVSIGNNHTSTVYDGVLSGANLVKVGLGTLTLTGLNTYSGNTTVAAGTLSFSQPNFSYGSTVTVANGAVLNLNAAMTNVVTALVLNGVSKPNGVYNSGNSGGLITGSGSIQVGITPDVWTGALSSEWSVNVLSSPYNWNYNGVFATNYTDGSAVLFDDTAANTTVDISLQNVLPVGVMFKNTNNSYTVQGSYGIAGTASLTKNGTNTLTLLNPNAFTGNMTINGGTVTIGSGGSLGGGTSYSGAITLATNSTLEYSSTSVTLAGNITGAGALMFDSAVSGPSLTLSGVNTYSGITTISNSTAGGGRIVAVATSTSPNTKFNIVGTSTGGGQLFINAAGTFANSFTISGVGYKESTGAQAGAIRLSGSDTLTGTITLAGNARIGGALGVGTETISGQITGNGDMDFYIYFINPNQANTILLANTNTATPNNYTGNTLVQNNYYNGSSAGNTTILKLGASEQIPNGLAKGILQFTGSSANRLTTLELNGFNETVNGINNTTAGPYSIIQNTTAGVSALTIGDGNTNSSFSGNITDGGITKALAINKIGTGTLTLSGIDTYNGGTAINGGTLLINNAAGSSGTGTNAVNINNGGTLGGTGFISSLVTNKAGGTLYPGVAGIGKLTLSGSVTLLAGSTNIFLVNGSTAFASNSVAVGAAITYGGVLNILTNGTFTVGQTFQLFSGTGATNTSNFASIAGDPGSGKSFSFTNGVLSVITTPTGPTLTSVTPNPAAGSSYAVTLSLSGSGFVSGCTVNLTNATIPVSINGIVPTFNSSSSLTVSAVVGTAASTWNATVINPGPAASGQATFNVTTPTKVTINTGNLNSAGAGKLVVSGTGGVAGNSYAVLSATNLNPPVVWTPVVTNKFDVSGNFGFTNTVSPSTPSMFLRIAQ